MASQHSLAHSTDSGILRIEQMLKENINQRRSIKLTNHKNEAAVFCYQISGN